MSTPSPPMPPFNETSTLSPSFASLIAPLEGQHITPLESKSNRPLRFSFDYQIRALIYYHTEAFTSAQDLLRMISTICYFGLKSQIRGPN